MKNSFFLAPFFGLVCSAMCAGGSPGLEQPNPIYTATTQSAEQAPALTAAESSPWSMEFSVTNWFATRSLMGGNTRKFNLWGPELTGVFPLSENHAFTLRSSAAFGRHSRAGYESIAPGQEVNIALGKLDLSLMPGFRYTTKATEQIKVYAGVNVGLMFTDVNKRHSYSVNVGGSESSWGVAAAVELGANYALDKECSLFAAYLLSGDTTHPSVNGHRQNSQFYHGVRVGMNVQF